MGPTLEVFVPDIAQLHRLFEDPRGRAVLPFVYAVWADGELDRDEIRLVCDRLRLALDGSGECGEALGDWLDPDSPPSAEALAELALLVRSMSESPAPDARPIDVARSAVQDHPALDSALSEVDREAGPFGPPAVAAWQRTRGRATLAPLPIPPPAEFDVEGVTSLLAGPHVEIKQRVRAILARPGFEPYLPEWTDDARALVTGWTSHLADEGIGGLGVPVEYGGAGDPGAFVAAFATVAHHDLSLLTKFGVQFGLFVGAVLRLGSPQHRSELLPSAVSFQLPGCFAMSETGHGSNVADLGTVARYEPDGGVFVIDTPEPEDRKDYIGNAARDGRVAIVFAQLSIGELDHGVHAFVVPIRDEAGRPSPGVDIGDVGEKGGLRGVDNGRLVFRGVRVPRTALLSRFARVDADGSYHSEISSPSRRFFTTLGTLVGGRVSVGVASISAAETCLAIAVRYATRRRQFSTGPGDETRLIDYPAHQRRLLTRLAATYAFHVAGNALIAEYVQQEAGRGDADVDRRAFEGRAAGFKAFATWHAVDVAQECREACGGQGYLEVNRLTRIRADVDVFTTFEGDNTVLAQLLTKSLLTEYRASFDDMTPMRMMRWLRRRISTKVTDSVPLVGAAGGDVADLDVVAGLLRRRRDHVLETLAARLGHRIDEGFQAGEAFVQVQPHVQTAARARVEHDVFEAFASETAVLGDPVVNDVAALAGLTWIEGDLGWFLEHGHLTPAKASDVRAAVTRLAGSIAPHARHLVDAFGIPDEVLAAPIAR